MGNNIESPSDNEEFEITEEMLAAGARVIAAIEGDMVDVWTKHSAKEVFVDMVMASPKWRSLFQSPL